MKILEWSRWRLSLPQFFSVLTIIMELHDYPTTGDSIALSCLCLSVQVSFNCLLSPSLYARIYRGHFVHHLASSLYNPSFHLCLYLCTTSPHHQIHACQGSMNKYALCLDWAILSKVCSGPPIWILHAVILPLYFQWHESFSARLMVSLATMENCK